MPALENCRTIKSFAAPGRRIVIASHSFPALAASLLLAVVLACSGRPLSKQEGPLEWRPAAAAAYLDQRASWWLGWENAARDHGTVCVSCHTGLPYLIARSAVRTALAETEETSQHRRFVESVVTRVRLWKEVRPYYTDQGSGPNKTVQSRGSEAVINAVVLANEDAIHGRMSDGLTLAFANMWTEQLKVGPLKGAWQWLDFGLKPWESSEAAYYGAALAALAVGMAPDDYQSRPGIHNEKESLRTYLLREYAAQPMMNRVFVLWASTVWPDLLGREQQQSLIKEILSGQHDDGGWSTASLAHIGGTVRSWVRKDGTVIDRATDGCATGLVIFVLQSAGMARGSPAIQRGLNWLAQHQDKEGFWYASSLNKRRTTSSDAGRFMTDAATAYAVLALSPDASNRVVVERIASVFRHRTPALMRPDCCSVPNYRTSP